MQTEILKKFKLHRNFKSNKYRIQIKIKKNNKIDYL